MAGSTTLRHQGAEAKQVTTLRTPSSISPLEQVPELAGHVKPEPRHRGPDRWRLVPSDRPIWALIMRIYTIDDIDEHFRVSEQTIAQAAADYDTTPEEVRAALAYYPANTGAVDTILAANTDLNLPASRG